MTIEEFHSLRYGSKVRDHFGYAGPITMIDFAYGIIHYMDEKKLSHYGREYTELDII